MTIVYNAEISVEAVQSNLKRLTNQIYKLLPNREENIDWEKPLNTIVEELAGMSRLLIEQHEILFCVLCKLEGLFTLTGEDDFMEFRRVIFESLGLMNTLRKELDT